MYSKVNWILLVLKPHGSLFGDVASGARFRAWPGSSARQKLETTPNLTSTLTHRFLHGPIRFDIAVSTRLQATPPAHKLTPSPNAIGPSPSLWNQKRNHQKVLCHDET